MKAVLITIAATLLFAVTGCSNNAGKTAQDSQTGSASAEIAPPCKCNRSDHAAHGHIVAAVMFQDQIEMAGSLTQLCRHSEKKNDPMDFVYWVNTTTKDLKLNSFEDRGGNPYWPFEGNRPEEILLPAGRHAGPFRLRAAEKDVRNRSECWYSVIVVGSETVKADLMKVPQPGPVVVVDD